MPAPDPPPLQARPRTDATTDGRRARGERSREALLDAAVQLASVEGLDGLSIAGLAGRLGAAKSTVHAAFGSKEALQVAALQHTREIFIDRVVAPALAAPAGRPRLEALGESWLDYLHDNVFEGGCLLSSASAELDGRPGPARDALTGVMREWLSFLADAVRAALPAGATDPDRVAFELNAIGLAANWHYQLFGDEDVFATARRAWTAALQQSGSGQADSGGTP